MQKKSLGHRIIPKFLINCSDAFVCMCVYKKYIYIYIYTLEELRKPVSK